MLKMIAFDADDTLWHNETLYTTAQDKLKEVLSAYLDTDGIEARLYETEMRNLDHFGYGMKSFTLSMIETAIELTEGQIKGDDIQQIINAGRKMLEAPLQLLEHVKPAVIQLSDNYPLMIITKGDLLDQETKIARSGLGVFFSDVEVVSEKSETTYQGILSRYGLEPHQFLMVGNSLRSDILPVVLLGGWAVHIPYHTTWAYETVTSQAISKQDYFELDHMGLLPELVEKLWNANR
jgi:putative hydrolase of the HAD superfamily